MDIIINSIWKLLFRKRTIRPLIGFNIDESMLYYPENDAYCCYSEVPEEIVPPPSRREIKLEAKIQVSNLLG